MILWYFFSKKLFCAGNKYEEKAEAGKYAKSADSGAFCKWSLLSSVIQTPIHHVIEILRRRLIATCFIWSSMNWWRRSEYPETCKIRHSDELKTCKIRHSSLFFLTFVRPEKTTGLGCGKGERENRDKYKYKKWTN